MTSRYKGEILELLEFLGPKLGDQTKSKQTLIKPKMPKKTKFISVYKVHLEDSDSNHQQSLLLSPGPIIVYSLLIYPLGLGEKSKIKIKTWALGFP